MKIRPAGKRDVKAAGEMGATLARMHAAWDPRRFFTVDDMEAGYAWWLGQEIENKKAVVLVAEGDEGAIVGFAYGRIEPRDWNSLREKCGIAIDLFVAPAARKHGVGRALADALVDALVQKGAPFVVLEVAHQNKDAQRFFRSIGARPTMIEMTLEPPGAKPPSTRRRKRAISSS